MNDWEDAPAAAAASGGWEDAPASSATSTAASVLRNAVIPAGAPTLVSGAVATPLAGIAGMAAALSKRLGITEAEAGDVVRKVQESLTIPPTTGADKAVVGAVSAPFEWLAGKADAAGGAVTDATGSPALGALANTAIQAAPAIVGKVSGGAMNAAGAALKNSARSGTLGIQSALKPNAAELRSGKAAAAIDTLLDEGVNVTRGGVENLQTKIDALNERITAAIDNSPATIDKQKVGYYMQGTLDKFRKQVAPLDDVNAIQKVWDEFLDVTPDKIPVATAQELKQGTYRAIGGKAYGDRQGAGVEAQKTLARGLKEEIAAAVPEVRPLNATESKLINALNLVERRALMDANKNPAGLGWLTLDPIKFGAWMADRSPGFKSVVARMLNRTAESLPGGETTSASALAGMQSSSMSEKRRRELMKQVQDYESQQ